MKVTIILIVLCIIFSCLFADEWIKVKDKDYKLTKIDTLQCIVIADGYYKVEITKTNTLITYEGGLGNYFFYEDNANNVKVNLSKEMKKRLKDKDKIKEYK